MITPLTQPRFRHSFRPLNIFSFCGQPVTAPRGEYVQATRNLPPCPDCQRARDAAVLVLGGTYRQPSAAVANGSSTAT